MSEAPAIVDRFGQPFPAPAKPPLRLRKFDAGQSDRLTASWGVHDQSINSEIYQYLRAMRSRSRDLKQNNEYAKHFFNLLINNVVGPRGVGFQSRAQRPDGTLDELDNKAIESRWKKWAKTGQCEVTRRLSLKQVERLFVECLACDGEVLLRRVRGYSNDQGYALEFIEPERLDIDLNLQPRDGVGQVVMGVELDRFNAPTYYHVLTRHPDNFQQVADPVRHERIPASDIIHAFIPMRPNQVRGVPWMHAGMRALRDLGGYREAAIVASRVGAAKMGIWTSEDGQSAPHDGVDEAGNLVTEAVAGSFIQAPTGTELHSWDPTYPHEQFDSFNKAILRGLAGAFGVAYFNLNNDLESVNFSSARAHILAEREFWMTVQNFMTDVLHDAIFPEWLMLQLGPMRLPPSRFDKFNSASWHPRRWQWVDPFKDEQANAMAYGMRTKSLRRIIEDRGDDPDEVWAEMAADQVLLARLGIPATLPNSVTLQQEAGSEPSQETAAPD